ncbi:hypothetical protein FRX31_033151, partial [Thalictrum thalictroides]
FEIRAKRNSVRIPDSNGFPISKIPTGVFTYEDWKRDMKTHRCRICDEIGHYQSGCEWMELCPTSARVSRFAEIVCWCCGEPPEINHPGVPLLDVALRAQLKRARPVK